MPSPTATIEESAGNTSKIEHFFTHGVALLYMYCIVLYRYTRSSQSCRTKNIQSDLRPGTFLVEDHLNLFKSRRA